MSYGRSRIQRIAVEGAASSSPGMGTVAVAENGTARVEIVLAQTSSSLSKK
jgi:hypothetical protein